MVKNCKENDLPDSGPDHHIIATVNNLNDNNIVWIVLHLEGEIRWVLFHSYEV